MEIYHTPGTCSDGIIILLEELETPYLLKIVDFSKEEQKTREFLDLNPKGKVPVLRLEDGAVLTQWIAIATYLAKLYPDAGFLSNEPLAMARALETIDFVTATIHMQGFSRIARPENFVEHEKDFEASRARGRKLAMEYLSIMEGHLAGNSFVAGDYGIADMALFYVEHWAAAGLGETLSKGCLRHYSTMMARPAVQRALQKR
jgi:glutathione S-transferase